jgi:hypothetical protein
MPSIYASKKLKLQKMEHINESSSQKTNLCADSDTPLVQSFNSNFVALSNLTQHHGLVDTTIRQHNFVSGGSSNAKLRFIHAKK